MILLHCPNCQHAYPFDNKAKVKISKIPWKHEDGRWVKIEEEDADWDPILEEYR
jgi:hypothetical protein